MPKSTNQVDSQQIDKQIKFIYKKQHKFKISFLKAVFGVRWPKEHRPNTTASASREVDLSSYQIVYILSASHSGAASYSLYPNKKDPSLDCKKVWITRNCPDDKEPLSFSTEDLQEFQGVPVKCCEYLTQFSRVLSTRSFLIRSHLIHKSKT